MKIRSIYRRVIGFAAYIKSVLKWTSTIYAQRNSLRRGVVNILVVKKRIYAGMATISLRSFASFNPDYRFRIFVDETTKKTVLRKTWILRKLIPNLIEVNKLHNSSETWQASKLNLILDLQGTNEIFMDADLRWNATLPRIENITFLVSEFEIELAELGISDVLFQNFPEKFTMKNTSFFTWNSREISQDTSGRVLEIQKYFYSSEREPSSRLNKSHLSEQLALSLLVNEFDFAIDFLKDSDTQYDGGLVESSYFGASGRRFGFLGDMNSRI